MSELAFEAEFGWILSALDGLGVSPFGKLQSLLKPLFRIRFRESPGGGDVGLCTGESEQFHKPHGGRLVIHVNDQVGRLFCRSPSIGIQHEARLFDDQIPIFFVV